MKDVIPELNDLLLSQSSFWMADALRISCLNGTYVLRITNTDVGVQLPETNELFYPNAVSFSRTAVEQKKGLEVGGFALEMDVAPEMGPLGQDPAFPVPLVQAAMNGAFDGADVMLYRVFAPGPPEPDDLFLGPVIQGAVARPLFFRPTGSILMFPGFMSDIQATATHLSCTVVSKLSLLDIKYPKNTFTPGCSWPLYSAGCGINKSDYAVSAQIVALNNSVLHVVSVLPGDSTRVLDKETNYYALGYVEFVTGNNTGFSVTIRENEGGHLKLARPTPFPVALGDRLIVYPGCDKRWDTCKNKFQNELHWRGFPYLPGPAALLSVPQSNAPIGGDIVRPSLLPTDVAPEKIGGSNFPDSDFQS